MKIQYQRTTAPRQAQDPRIRKSNKLAGSDTLKAKSLTPVTTLQRNLQSAAKNGPQASYLNGFKALADAHLQTESLPAQRHSDEPRRRKQASTPGKKSSTPYVPAVSQLVYDGFKKLRIGVIYADDRVPAYAAQLPAHTYVWLLSNKVVGARDFPNVTYGQNKSSPNEIISANAGNVGKSVMQDENRSGGEVVSRIFQSGAFKIPRNDDVRGNRNLLDYSFWRFAALKSYKNWFASTDAAAKGWPDIEDKNTLVESIDSDESGVTGSTNAAKDLVGEANEESNWLAVAGLYRWDWTDVKDHATIAGLFGKDGAARDAALREFSDQYTEAEGDARAEVAREIFKIYFPEPATRLSSAAVKLLTNSGLGDMAISIGSQIGHKRESIGMIAALVRLDERASGKGKSKSKAKLSFDRSFVATTGLGDRKGAYVSLFSKWHAKAKIAEGGFRKVDISGLNGAAAFDQSYLNDDLPGNVMRWHDNTYAAMSDDNETRKRFFNPK